MDSHSVRSEKQGDITIVTLDRPEVRNAVDSATARALHEAFLAFEADADARVAVFHGDNGHFCAGWDLQFGAKLQAAGTGALDNLDYSLQDVKPIGPWGRLGCCCPSQ